MTWPHSLSLSVSSDTGDDPSSGGAPPSTDSQPTCEDTVMDLGRTEVSDTSESSLHCTFCSTCQSCPVEPALSFAVLGLSCMLSLYVSLSVTVYVLLYMYTRRHIFYLEWYGNSGLPMTLRHALTLFCMCPLNYAKCPHMLSAHKHVRTYSYYRSAGIDLFLLWLPLMSTVWIQCSKQDLPPNPVPFPSTSPSPSPFPSPSPSSYTLPPPTCVQTCPIADSRHSVRNRHLHGIMESQCRAHEHSVQFPFP